MLKPKASTTTEAIGRAQEPLRRKLHRGIWIFMAIAVFFAGLMSAGVWLRRQVRPLDAYSLLFERIACPDPPGQKHQDFLGEVRYLGELPEKLAILDENTIQHVAGAFAKHPWVEKVIRVDLALPRPRVLLVFRTPVLAVAEEESGTKRVRIVDRDAMRLPADASAEGLPRYRVPGNAPMPTLGQRYVDPNVRTAAKTAGYLHDFLATWHIDTVQVDLSGLGLTSVNGTRILWGHAPGLELSTEAPAARKRDWLRAYFESHGRATDRRPAVLIDVRGPTEMTVQQIPVLGNTSR